MRRLIRTIAVASIACGVVTHVVFDMYVSPIAGRTEMGEFACFEGLCYALGLMLFLLNIVLPFQDFQPSAGGDHILAHPTVPRWAR